MVKLITILTILTSFNLFAQSKPEGLLEENFQEGTVTRLDKNEMAKFQDWAMNVRFLLDEGLFDSRNLSPSEKVDYLKETIKKTVLLSGENYYQRLVRYTLNRGMLLADYVGQDSIVGTSETQINILIESIKLAKVYYKKAKEFEKDVYVSKADLALSQAEFGIVFSTKMYEAVMSVQALNSQVRSQYKVLEMLLWDLYSDRESRKYAFAIKYIFDELEKINLDKEVVDLNLYRKLNYVYLKAERLIQEED